jgi:hypothetical protein
MAAVIGTDGAHEMVTTLLSQKMQIKFRDAKISVGKPHGSSSAMTAMQDKQSGFRSIKKKESTTRKIHFNFQADGAAMLLRKLKEWKVNGTRVLNIEHKKLSEFCRVACTLDDYLLNPSLTRDAMLKAVKEIGFVDDVLPKLKFSEKGLNPSTKEKKLNFALYLIELLGELFLNPSMNVSESSGFEKFFHRSNKKKRILDD